MNICDKILKEAFILKLKEKEGTTTLDKKDFSMFKKDAYQNKEGMEITK